MEQIDPLVYVYAGAYKAFYESATKQKFSDADIDKNIKSFQKIRLIIDFEAYKDMLCDLLRKCNKRELKTITPHVLEYYAKIYTSRNNEEK